MFGCRCYNTRCRPRSVLGMVFRLRILLPIFLSVLIPFMYSKSEERMGVVKNESTYSIIANILGQTIWTLPCWICTKVPEIITA